MPARASGGQRDAAAAHVFVRLAQQLVAAVGRKLPVRGSYSTLDRNVEAPAGDQLAELLPEAWRHEVALARARVLEENDELVGPVARDEIRGACRFHQRVGSRRALRGRRVRRSPP